MADYYRTGAPYAAGGAVQSPADTYTDPAWFLPFTSFEPDDGITDEPIQAHTGGRTTDYGLFRSKVEPKLAISSPIWPENGLEPILYSVLGDKEAPAKQGETTAYKHVLNEGVSLPKMSYIQWAGATIGETMAYQDCICDTVELNFTPEKLDLSANYFTNAVTLGKVTPSQTYASADPFVWKDFICKLGDYGSTPTQNTTITNASVQISNGIIVEQIANNSYNNLKIPGPLAVSGRIEFPMQNLDDYKEYIGGSTTATTIGSIIKNKCLTLKATGQQISGTYYYDMEIVLPKVAYRPVAITREDDKSVKYGIDFLAFRDPTTAETLHIDIISKLTAIT